MKNNIETPQQLKSVIDYILWNYNENGPGTISNRNPIVIVQDLSNVWMCRIVYIAGTRKVPMFVDPTLGDEDEDILETAEFSLLKKESFRQLTKYVEDICEEINKLNLEA